MGRKRSEPKEQSLEDMIRAAAANGELTHLSLIPVAGKGPGNIGWAASYSPASKWGQGFGRDPEDPVKALKAALTDDRLGKVVTTLFKTLDKAAPTNPRAAAAAASLDVTGDDSDLDFSEG